MSDVALSADLPRERQQSTTAVLGRADAMAWQRHTHRLRPLIVLSVSFVAALVAGLVAGTVVPRTVAAQQQLDSGANKEIDRQLLDNLLQDTKPRKPERPLSSTQALGSDTADEESSGEQVHPVTADLGENKAPSMTWIERSMRVAQRKLVAGDLTQSTLDLQVSIVSELDQLIGGLQRRCLGDNLADNRQDGASRESSKSPGGAVGHSPALDGSGAPQDSSLPRASRVSDDSVASDSAEAAQQAWGHLPPRLQQALIQSRVERFLPKYERLIEAYYRRLAAEQSSER